MEEGGGRMGGWEGGKSGGGRRKGVGGGGEGESGKGREGIKGIIFLQEVKVTSQEFSPDNTKCSSHTSAIYIYSNYDLTQATSL